VTVKEGQDALVPTHLADGWQDGLLCSTGDLLDRLLLVHFSAAGAMKPAALNAL